MILNVLISYCWPPTILYWPILDTSIPLKTVVGDAPFFVVCQVICVFLLKEIIRKA